VTFQGISPISAGVTVIIPSLGAPPLKACLEAVANLDPPPDRTILVLPVSVDAPPGAPQIEILRSDRPLGFAAAANLAIDRIRDSATSIALLNDDAVPPPNWLDCLCRALMTDCRLAAVQGTVTDISGSTVDGRGIALDCYGLPVQVDHGRRCLQEPTGQREMLAVSGTAALYRVSALHDVSLADGTVFDASFGSYHEDLDLGLRLRRLGWTASWIGGAVTRHEGSTTGKRLRWDHPWWLLANRWRVLAGNLRPTSFVATLPRFLRGEVRAVRTLTRSNPRAVVVSLAVIFSLPVLVGGCWQRHTKGPRLRGLPGVP